jgi:hypothetical protein
VDLAKWWSDWQSVDHATKFDFRASVPSRVLVRDFESFSDIQLLKEVLGGTSSSHLLLEVGCATGDFYRYLGIRYPGVRYSGIDVSNPAVTRARSKYPQAQFITVDPAWTPETVVEFCGWRPDIVFSKDVIHHQVDPLGFLARLLAMTSQNLIFRTRTRDNGPTEWDPEKSCQYHYGGWMPYIIINLSDLIEHIRRTVPGADIVIHRNHMILGGRCNRYVPKDCYLESTGTAETAVRVSVGPGVTDTVTVNDRRDANPAYSKVELGMLALRKLRSISWRA